MHRIAAPLSQRSRSAAPSAARAASPTASAATPWPRASCRNICGRMQHSLLLLLNHHVAEPATNDGRVSKCRRTAASRRRRAHTAWTSASSARAALTARRAQRRRARASSPRRGPGQRERRVDATLRAPVIRWLSRYCPLRPPWKRALVRNLLSQHEPSASYEPVHEGRLATLQGGEHGRVLACERRAVTGDEIRQPRSHPSRCRERRGAAARQPSGRSRAARE